MSPVFLSEFATLIFESPDNDSFFYGYYNTPQMNKLGNRILGHRINFENRNPTEKDSAEIGFFSLPEGKWHKLGITKAFNWQQGSHLQWLGPDFSTHIIYNDQNSDGYISRILNIENGDIKTLPFPIYAVDPLGKFSISIDYQRAHWTRAYSYAGVENQELNKIITDSDGYYKLNLETGELHQIFKLKTWLESKSKLNNSEDWHWVEHPILNQHGNLIFGYYRYGNTGAFDTKGFILDSNNGNVVLEVDLNKNESFTHIGWSREDEVFMYIMPKKEISSQLVNPEQASFFFRTALSIYRKILKPFVPRDLVVKITAIDSYYRIFKLSDQSQIDIKLKELAIDGHPSITSDRKFMLTDTYQDTYNFRNLYLLHIASKRIFLLGRFYSFVNNMPWRADLHPKFSSDEESIIIDSNTNGYHQIRVIKINWDLVKKEINE